MKDKERSVFGRNLRAFRSKESLTQQEVGDRIGVSNAAVNLWENKGVQPRRKVVDDLMAAYGLSEDDLLSDTNGCYARLHGLTDAPAGALAPAPTKPAYAPLYGRVHAGDATDPDVLDDRVPMPHEVKERHPNGYFLEVEGTCMNRVYTEHSYIYVDRDIEPCDGQIAVFSIDGEGFLVRRLRRGASTLVLSPDSDDSAWDDIVVREGDGRTVEFVGTVVWFQSREELG